jgi:hypothetical protein
MGWYYTHGAQRQDIVEELTQDNKYYRTLAHCLRGNVLWTVHENNDLIKWIGCYLLSNGGDHSGWGYKPMDESMYPYYFTCPKKYLSMTPVACQEWRDGVLDYHSRSRSKKT